MIVFLFGAGASFGAGAILPERPPLGGGLYSELRRLFPGSWGSLPEAIAGRLGNDFEGGMAAVAEQISQAVPQLMREMAIYFVQFRSIGQGSLYDRLIGALSSRSLLSSVVFSTLNYECILEYALVEAGCKINYFNDRVIDEVSVLKLHGSCNMFSSDIEATPGVSYSGGVVFEGGIRAWLDSNRVIEHCLTQTALAPVMCQYMAGKPTSVSPSAIKVLQTRWAAAVAEASMVVCVGVRPNLADDHIWEPLGQTPAKVFFVGDRAPFDHWLRETRRGPSSWLASTFVDGYEPILANLGAR